MMGCIQVRKDAGDGAEQCRSKEQKISGLSSCKTETALEQDPSGKPLRDPKEAASLKGAFRFFAALARIQYAPGSAPECAADMFSTAKAMLKINMAPMRAAIEP
jgi:hypothetical protein